MNWFLIAISAPFLWALVNISDQYLIEKYTHDKETSTGALVLFSSLTGIIMVIFIGFFAHNIFLVSFVDQLLLVTTGILTILWVILYLFALKIEKVSGIVPWFLTVPAFGYLLGYLFLGETLTFTQQIGSFIVFLGILFLSIDFSNKGNTHFKWKVGLYMIPACFLISLIGVIFKYVAIVDDFWVSSFWVYFGLALSGIFIYLFISSYRRSFLHMIKKGGARILTLNLSSEFLSNIGNLLTTYASLFAPVVMVYLVGSFQPAILLILTIICTKFFPKIITENMSKRVLVPKVLSILIIILGSMVLFI